MLLTENEREGEVAHIGAHLFMLSLKLRSLYFFRSHTFGLCLTNTATATATETATVAWLLWAGLFTHLVRVNMCVCVCVCV